MANTQTSTMTVKDPPKTKIAEHDAIWKDSNKDNWTIHHWIIHLVDVHPVVPGANVPVYSKQDKVPYAPQLPQHFWILFFALIPMLLQQAFISLSPFDSLHPLAAFTLYFAHFNLVVLHEVHLIRRLGLRYGFLDGDAHDRDGVPEMGIDKIAAAIFKTTGSRLIMLTLFTYNAGEQPLFDTFFSLRWVLWLTVKIGLYGVVLDFWFYWYHRAMHDVPRLWQFHRTHHLSKHPNPLLSAFADHEQEFFDMAVVPFLTYVTMYAMGVRLGFYDWWICHQYIAYTEVSGHSGLRVHATPPSTFCLLLRMFDAEICIEDHDLHHRKGWRKSHNYGKQTRVWDRIFGTCADRIESAGANIDYANQARMPLF